MRRHARRCHRVRLLADMRGDLSVGAYARRGSGCQYSHPISRPGATPTVSARAISAMGTVGAGDQAATAPTSTNQTGTRARQRNTRAADNVFMKAAYRSAEDASVLL